METVAVTKEVPKDAKEMIDVVISVVNHFVQKKPFAELLGELPAVMGAVDGWENAVDAVKGQGLGETVGYLVGEIVEIFEKEEEVVVDPPTIPTA